VADDDPFVVRPANVDSIDASMAADLPLSVAFVDTSSRFASISSTTVSVMVDSSRSTVSDFMMVIHHVNIDGDDF